MIAPPAQPLAQVIQLHKIQQRLTQSIKLLQRESLNLVKIIDFDPHLLLLLTVSPNTVLKMRTLKAI